MFESERRTRNVRIDPKLTAAKWTVAAPVSLERAQRLSSTAVRELPTPAGPADYALCDTGSVVGVVEAKKVALGPQEVLAQAERYSRAIAQHPRYQKEFGVP